MFGNDSRRQPLECSADLVQVNEVGVVQLHDSSAAAVSLGYEALGSQDIECFSNGNLCYTKLAPPSAFDNFLAGNDSSCKDFFAQLCCDIFL